VADISFAVFILLVLAAMSVACVRAAWLHWTDPDRAPSITTTPCSTNPSVIRGHERGIVPLAVWVVSLTIGGIAAAVGDASPAATMVEVLFVLGSLPLLMLHGTIAWFNRPKFLRVIPYWDATRSVPAWGYRRWMRRSLRGRLLRRGP
jgi:hypothetical protein